MARAPVSDAIERVADPVADFRAPVVSGGVGREDGVPWCASDDAMLLLGVYKHGYRAYYEIRDDPELTCALAAQEPARAAVRRARTALPRVNA